MGRQQSLAALVVTLWGAGEARADAAPEATSMPETTSTSEAIAMSEPASEAPGRAEGTRVVLGLRGFGGVMFEDGPLGTGGGMLLAAFPFASDRWEIELSLGLARKDDEPLGLTELIVKRVFETEGPWSPHVILGPLLSIDFGEDFAVSAGLVAGGGATYWVRPRFGVCGDAALRVLFGEENMQAITASLGIAVAL